MAAPAESFYLLSFVRNISHSDCWLNVISHSPLTHLINKFYLIASKVYWYMKNSENIQYLSVVSLILFNSWTHLNKKTLLLPRDVMTYWLWVHWDRHVINLTFFLKTVTELYFTLLYIKYVFQFYWTIFSAYLTC